MSAGHEEVCRSIGGQPPTRFLQVQFPEKLGETKSRFTFKYLSPILQRCDNFNIREIEIVGDCKFHTLFIPILGKIINYFYYPEKAHCKPP